MQTPIDESLARVSDPMQEAPTPSRTKAYLRKDFNGDFSPSDLGKYV
jgi:hypothetical protein